MSHDFGLSIQRAEGRRLYSRTIAQLCRNAVEPFLWAKALCLLLACAGCRGTTSTPVDQSDSHVSDKPVSFVPIVGENQARQEKLAALLDPSSTGWTTEALNEAAGGVLKKLAHEIEGPGTVDLAALIAPEFQCSALRPDLTERYRQGTIAVHRQVGQALPSPCSPAKFAQAISHLRDCGKVESAREPPDADYHVKFKIVSVALNETDAKTVVLADGAGDCPLGRLQWRATWHVLWSVPTVGEPRLESLVVEDYEESLLEQGRGWLTDQTSGVLGGSTAFADQLRFGMEHWVRRLESPLGANRLGHNGIAIGDFDGDGRHDLYVCQPGGLPNRLFVTQPDGTAQDRAPDAGVDFLDDSTCALWVDLDNDNDQDLALVTVAGGVLLENDGDGHLSKRGFLPECGNAFSLTSADYNLDGKLDLYVGRYWPTAEERGDIPLPVPYFDATNGGANVLFRNQGNWEFADVTETCGLSEGNSRFTMASAWADLDNDGDDDLYVANDFGKNCLYRNDDGQFKNIAAAAGVEDAASGMSVTFGDYDGDGLFDIYISNMFSSAGNRITYQRQYADRFGASTQALQHMARGNTLFRNLGNGAFEDVSESATVTMGRWAWGSLFVDLNNDALEDLLVLNGNITTEDTGDL